MDTDFTTWLMRELEHRGWTNAELARRANISPANVSMVLSGQKGIGLDFCIGVGRALGEPPEKILRLVGLLPTLPPAVEEEKEALTIIRELPIRNRELILTMLRALAGRPSQYTAVSKSQSAYDVASERERQLIEEFRRLSPEWQEVALEEVQRLEQLQVRFIGGDDIETPQEKINAA